MSKKNSLLLALALVIGIILLFVSNQTEGPDMTNVIIVGTNAEFRPFTFINEQNEIVGFDIDVVNEVARRLGKTIMIKDLSFDMLIPEAQNGYIRMIAAGMTATPERAAQIFFTTPYLQGEPLVVVTRKENPIHSLEDLKHHEVIVNEGYTADAYISAQPDIVVKRLPSPTESFMDLQTGKSFAYVSGINAVAPFIEKFGADSFNVFTISDAQENTALGVSKMYPELFEQVKPVIDQMIADGTIEQLKKKWNLQ